MTCGTGTISRLRPPVNLVEQTSQGNRALGQHMIRQLGAQPGQSKGRIIVKTPLGVVLEEELAGLVPVPRSVFAERRIAAATSFAAGESLGFLSSGIGDPATEYGYAAGQLTEARTNLQRQGKIPSPELFICTGVAFEFNDNVTRPDLRLFERARVEIRMNNAQNVVPLGLFPEFPPAYFMNSSYTGAAAAASEVDVRRDGPAYLPTDPLFVIRGRVEVSESTQVHLLFSEAAGPTAAENFLRLRCFGMWYRNPPGGRPPETRVF